MSTGHTGTDTNNLLLVKLYSIDSPKSWRVKTGTMDTLEDTK